MLHEATDVAACKKKKDTVNVAHVINFDFPLNPVDYIHRIGRTGRGGGTGRVTNLVTKVCGHIYTNIVACEDTYTVVYEGTYVAVCEDTYIVIHVL